MMERRLLALALLACLVSEVLSEKGLCATPCELPEVCEPCGEHHCCRYPDGVRHWGKWCCYRYCQYGEVCVSEACHQGSECKWPWLVQPGEKFEADSSAAAATAEYLKYLESGGDPSAEAFLASIGVDNSLGDGDHHGDHHGGHHGDHHGDHHDHKQGHGEHGSDGDGDHAHGKHSDHEGGHHQHGDGDHDVHHHGSSHQHGKDDTNHSEFSINAVTEINTFQTDLEQGTGSQHSSARVTPDGNIKNQALSTSPLETTTSKAPRKRYPWSSYSIVTVYDENGEVLSEEVIPPEGASSTSSKRGRSYQRIQRN